MVNNENLEKLLQKSARLLSWYECNKTSYFQTYFNKHFAIVRSNGYFVCCEQMDTNTVEVYFRAINNPVYRTCGEKIRTFINNKN
jgi:hypothetical protein